MHTSQLQPVSYTHLIRHFSRGKGCFVSKERGLHVFALPDFFRGAAKFCRLKERTVRVQVTDEFPHPPAGGIIGPIAAQQRLADIKFPGKRLFASGQIQRSLLAAHIPQLLFCLGLRHKRLVLGGGGQGNQQGKGKGDQGVTDGWFHVALLGLETRGVVIDVPTAAIFAAQAVLLR